MHHEGMGGMHHEGMGEMHHEMGEHHEGMACGKDGGCCGGMKEGMKGCCEGMKEGMKEGAGCCGGNKCGGDKAPAAPMDKDKPAAPPSN